MKHLALVLLIFLAGAGIYTWWMQGTSTVAITGDATVKAVPDQFVFTPSYQAKDADQEQAKSKASQIGNEVVQKLRDQGVQDRMLTSSVSVAPDYSYIMPMPTGQVSGYSATYMLTVKVDTVDLARKVQSTLVGTPLVGALTPWSTLQAATRNTLEREARKLAMEDAKAQATDTVDTLGVRILGITSIGQPMWGGVTPLAATLNEKADVAVAPAGGTSPDLLVGEQEVSYSIQIIYRVR
ncbi:SIMPL domain-containing protein [Candidatus Berkelbacteria bacterium]|nr:SIMPL domain-containing protein [Candidatus Berkelbacteria bacterium]